MDRHTDTLTDANLFYLIHAICCSYGTDNNVPFDNTTPDQSTLEIRKLVLDSELYYFHIFRRE